MRWSPRSKSCSKMLRSIAWHGMRAVEFSKGDYAALLVPDMGANLVRLADTRRGIEILRAPAGDEVEEFRRAPACVRTADPLPAQPHCRRAIHGSTAHLPLPDHRRERRPLSPRHSQEPAFRRVEGVGNRGRGAGRMPLLFECGERCDIPRFPARVQVQDRIPPHGRRAGTGGDVRQPQQGADARRRGVPYADADPLRRRGGRRLRDACGDWRTS